LKFSTFLCTSININKNFKKCQNNKKCFYGKP
jgi:hypothetical protein